MNFRDINHNYLGHVHYTVYFTTIIASTGNFIHSGYTQRFSYLWRDDFGIYRDLLTSIYALKYYDEL